VTKLDRLARSLPDARDILDELTKRNVKLSLGGSIHDPTDPVGRLLFNVLAMVAEFEADLIRMRTREGMKIARAKGRLRGKQPKLKPNQAKHLLELHDLGTYTQAELAETLRRRPIDGVPDHRANATHATRTGAAIRTSRESTG
jgi:DNA invertase Pin-like site-specific DNA recombinase